MIFDLIILVILVYAIYIGFSKGLIIQLASILALVLGIFGGIRFSDYLSKLLTEKFSLTGEYLPILSFTLIFIGIVIAVHLVARITEKLIKLVALGFVNRITGAILSLLKYALILSVFLGILNGINKRVSFLPEKQIKESHLYKPVSMLATVLFPYLHFDIILQKALPEERKGEILA